MKKMLVVFGMTILTFGLLTGCGCQKKEDNKNKDTKNEEIKTNTNEDVIKDQTVDVFKFEKTSLIYENGNSKLQTTVTNTSSEKQYLAEFLIHVKDENGNEIVTMTGFVGDSIDANASKIIDSTYGDDLTKAASIEYEVVKS